MLISDVPEDAMLKIKRPVGVLANRSLHQNLMHSGCCEIAASYIHANPPGLSGSLPDMTPISRSPVWVALSPG